MPINNVRKFNFSKWLSLNKPKGWKSWFGIIKYIMFS